MITISNITSGVVYPYDVSKTPIADDYYETVVLQRGAEGAISFDGQVTITDVTNGYAPCGISIGVGGVDPTSGSGLTIITDIIGRVNGYFPTFRADFPHTLRFFQITANLLPFSPVIMQIKYSHIESLNKKQIVRRL